MKLVVFLAAFLGVVSGAWAEAPGGLRVMSFNIRNSAASDGDNQWSNRREMFVGTIRTFDPDLLGLQEVLADQHDELVAALSSYSPVGVARKDGVRKGEWSLIFFRTARFEQLDSGTFWLSEHPEEVGSKSWDAALERICTWVKLRDRTTGKELVYANAHFDHKGPESRRQSALLVRARLAKMAGTNAAVLTGDFNCTEDDPAYGTLVAQEASSEAGVRLTDSYREVHSVRTEEEASAHGFKGRKKGSRIDWILHTEHFRATAAEIVRTSVEGRYPSDHFAVTAVLEAR